MAFEVWPSLGERAIIYQMNELVGKYKNWKYKNTLFLALSLILLFLFSDSTAVKNFISQVGGLGYFGIFITGLFFVSTFTVAPASIVLYFLSGQFNPVTIALVAGFGAAVGDLLILKFLKDRVFEELSPIFIKMVGKRVSRLFKTPYFAWLAPVVGTLIIASPFPDEIGIGLLGVSTLKSWQFFLISFISNAVGICVIISVARAV